MVTTAFAPAGAYLTHVINPTAIWVVYLVSVSFLAYRLFRPVKERPGAENYRAALAWAVPISALSGLLGVGPGFLLMPVLILVGYETKKAAAINAVAVTPPSFFGRRAVAACPVRRIAGRLPRYGGLHHHPRRPEPRPFPRIAIQGPGAFRRFKDVLATSPARHCRPVCSRRTRRCGGTDTGGGGADGQGGRVVTDGGPADQ